MTPTLLLSLAMSTSAHAARVDVELLAFQTDWLGGAPQSLVANIGVPWTNNDGSVSFIADNADGTMHLVLDGVPIYDDIGSTVMEWSNDTTGSALSASQFAYTGVAYGTFSARLFTDRGVLLTAGDPAPRIPSPATLTTVSRPQVYPGGGLSFWAAYDPSGGTSTDGSAIYFSPDGTVANANRLLASGDLVSGVAIAGNRAGLGFEGRVNPDGLRYIQRVELVGSASANDAVVVSGDIVAREGDPDLDGDVWDQFGLVDMNDGGDWVFVGSSDASYRDVVVYNGQIVAESGLTDVGGEVLLPGIVRVLGINNEGNLVHGWRRLATWPGPDQLFATCDPTRPDQTTHLLLEEGDTIDWDGDGVADATIDSFLASDSSAPQALGKPMGDDDVVHIGVDMAIGGYVYEAMIALETPCCTDSDQDDVCNDVDPCPFSALDDADGDGVCEDVDICLGDDATGDPDGDGLCGDIDPCLGDNATGDDDNDGICNDTDLCLGNNATGDADDDGICGNRDQCTGDDATGDVDQDGVCGDLDLCAGDDATGDTDSDGVCDDNDICLGRDSTGDIDNDGICGNLDDCIGDDLSGDADDDGVCNDTDVCPFDRLDDSDGDGTCDSDDLCFGLDISDDSDGDGLCNDQDFVLFTTAIVPGQDVTLVAFNAPPGATVEFLVSQRGPGDEPCVGSVCGNLDSPISIATLPVPASGTVRLDARAPRFLTPGDYLFFQAVWANTSGADVTEVDLRRVRMP